MKKIFAFLIFLVLSFTYLDSQPSSRLHYRGHAAYKYVTFGSDTAIALEIAAGNIHVTNADGSDTASTTAGAVTSDSIVMHRIGASFPLGFLSLEANVTDTGDADTVVCRSITRKLHPGTSASYAREVQSGASIGDSTIRIVDSVKVYRAPGVTTKHRVRREFYTRGHQIKFECEEMAAVTGVMMIDSLLLEVE